MAKIIVGAPPFPGDFSPLLQIGRGFASRGHQVTVLAWSSSRAAVEEAGLAFAAPAGAADYDLEEETALNAKQEPGPPQLNFGFSHSFIDPMPGLHTTLQELLRQDPDQYLVANMLFTGAWPVRQGAPGLRPRRWVSVSAAPLLLDSADTTFFGPVPVGPGEDPKASNRAANAQFRALLQPTDARADEVLAELGGAPLTSPFIDTIYTLADATAILTVPGLEFERSDTPDSVHMVGILPGPDTVGWQPPAWWEELDGSRPVVVVTQGTLANRDLSALIEPTLRGLADRDVTVVAALGRGTGPLSVPLPPNARAAEFIPFDILLPKADVFITNGGFGGTQQALAAGVPVIAAGLTEDKPAVAARVAHHGVGINLQTASPEPEAVAAATDAILADPAMRDNARKLAREYATHDALSEIERLLLA
jgi:UDP:flavonoid glycosyltransferase YjiC (YdhE family)